MRAVTVLMLLLCTGCVPDLTSFCLFPIDGSDACSRGDQSAGGRGPRTLAFRVPPGNTTAGMAITPPVEVVLVDSDGRVHNVSTRVTLRIIVNPAGGTLSGTTTVLSVDGVAVFPDLSIDRPGVRYGLEASASGYISVSSGFDVAEKP